MSKKEIDTSQLMKALSQENSRYESSLESLNDPNMMTYQGIVDHWKSVRDNIVDSGLYFKTDDDSWINRNLHRLLNLSLCVGQASVPINHAVRCRRIIRVKAYIPKYIYENLNIESVYLGGMYALVEGLMITPSQSEQLSLCKCINRSALESFDLPVEGYRYQVMRDIPSLNSKFILADNDFSKYITNTHKWSYFDIVQGVEILSIFNY